MISKFRFSLIAVIMLVLLGFGFQNQANGQPARGSLCPLAPYTTGFTDIELANPANPLLPIADFSAGILGTVEADGGDLVAGWDWMHSDETVLKNGNFGIGSFATNLTGSQIIVPWNQNNGLNTYVQLTNSADQLFNEAFIPPIPVPVVIHVQVFDENCNEIINFCDPYTGNDTHEYNLSDFVANGGQIIPDLLAGEGFITMTPVKFCDTPEELAIAHNFMAGQVQFHSSKDYLYGANAYARKAICVPVERCFSCDRRGQ